MLPPFLSNGFISITFWEEQVAKELQTRVILRPGVGTKKDLTTLKKDELLFNSLERIINLIGRGVQRLL